MTDQTPTPLLSLLSAESVLALHDRLTALWHGQEPAPGDAGKIVDSITDAVAEQHRVNFELWHLEDQARAPRATEREITAIKRTIDSTNQRRNDLMERCDSELLAALDSEGLPLPAAELHSESPGLILDRLSILALKIFHTQEEIARPNAPEGHAERNRERLQLLETQRSDLAGCLDSLWRAVLKGERRFKLYRQLKMYNDPSLNPVLYRQTERR
jgi:Protein of unknown function (DUF4254)